MNREELISEFQSRGFDYLSTSRASNYINAAYQLDICEEEDWPFLEASKEGKAPLEIADLRAVEFVVDTAQNIELLPLDRRHLVAEVNSDLGTVGTPSVYYLTGGNTINVFSVNTENTLLVRYWKAPEALTGSATPLVPSRFHSMIVDFAVARAYEDSDDYELARAAYNTANARLERMRASYGSQHADGPDQYIEITDQGY